MRRILIVLASLAAMLSLAAVALADSPHFTKGPTVTQGATSLTVTAKVSGLGTGDYADFSLSGTGTAVYGCFNKGGNHPQATNKEGPSTLTSSGSFPVKGGSTTLTLTVSLPASTLDCPGGQHTEFMSGSITGLTLSGTGISASLGDYTF